MKKQNLEGCKRRLEAMREELRSGHYKMEGISVERVSDSMEELTLEMERSMAVDTLNRKAALLEEVAGALERIAEGSYGLCVTCEKAISPKRLTALPWAARCLECQQSIENQLNSHVIAGSSLRMRVSA